MDNKTQIFNIFPTTIYVGQVEGHNDFKKEFLKLYDKFDYEDNEISSTVSEGQVNPLIHLEPSMDTMFKEIVRHIKIYVLNILKFKDMFNYSITKTWISRTRNHKEIPWHIHSTSHVSFVYYLNIPPYSHTTQFLNRENFNSLFLGANSYNNIDDKNMMKEFNELNSQTFYIHPKEGHVSLFPSRLSHSTGCIKTDFTGERLSIVGDVNLILKDEFLLHSMGLIDEKYWKKYE
tara:strand:+ start:522 stop:1220 length:699 start_codon:yes stop_codon:yes gene_type:complete